MRRYLERHATPLDHAAGRQAEDFRTAGKDILRQSMENFATDRREGRERLEQARRERALQIWHEAAQAEAQAQASEPRDPSEVVNEANEANEEA